MGHVLDVRFGLGFCYALMIFFLAGWMRASPRDNYGAMGMSIGRWISMFIAVAITEFDE